MKKRIYKERYYKNIEHNGDNYGKKEVTEDKTEVVDAKPKQKNVKEKE